jgi:hypothetical protein
MAFGKPKKEKIDKVMGANIEDTLNAIKTKFGEDSIMKLGDKPHVDVNAISTGSIGLDSALGVGGLAVFGQTNLFGQLVSTSTGRFQGNTSGTTNNYLSFGYDGVHSFINSNKGAGSPGLAINWGTNEDVSIGGGAGGASSLNVAGSTTTGQDLRILSQTGSGTAYACLDSSGKLFRSATPCDAVACTHGTDSHTSGSGSFTWTSSMCSPVTVQLWGGGGGGAGANVPASGPGPHLKGGGGGGAGYISFTPVVSNGVSISWSVGNGGTPGYGNQFSPTGNATDGGQGGTTSFGSTYKAFGGSGGIVGSVGGAGGGYAGGAGANGSAGANGGSCNTYPCTPPAGGNSGNGGAFPSNGGGGEGGSPTSPTTEADPQPGAPGKILITW